MPNKENKTHKLRQKLARLIDSYEAIYSQLPDQSSPSEHITLWERLADINEQVSLIEKELNPLAKAPEAISERPTGQDIEDIANKETQFSQFGPYQIISLIGHGPHTSVYLAHDPKEDQDVAVEILSPALANDPSSLGQFEHDIETIIRLQHEAIVPVYKYGEYKGQPYLVARYMSGGSLHNRITDEKHRRDNISVAEVQVLLSRLTGALEAAHAQGIVHGHIKPANILADDEGVWYLSHFGFIRLVEPKQTISHDITSPSPYLAPEQWRGEAVGTHTDVYQLGVVLFEILTGQLPFNSEPLPELINNHLYSPIPSANALNRKLPVASDAVIARAMAKDPSERYSSVAELGVALARAMTQKQIGRYKIKKELGRGATATVYLARDPRFSRDVAIKLLPASHTSESRKRFEQEVKLIANLEHNTIVPVYDFEEYEGVPYLVMRYMTGGSLLDRLQNESGPLSWMEVQSLLKRLVAALQQAHDRNIIHCDIKPGNVLLDEIGDPYLSDFGIAHHLDQTMTAAISGTPDYMAPEQWAGDEIGIYTDVYQLGVMTFQLLTGERPFVADTLQLLIKKHLEEPAPSAAALNPSLPPACDDVFHKAMAKKPEARFATPLNFLTALTSAMTTKKIGRYEIQRILGQGGMAEVYLAYDPQLERDVAIKKLPHTYTSSDSLRRFKQEARMIAKLEHDAIVPVYDVGEQEEGIPYLVMRYMLGGTLRERMDAHQGALPPGDVMAILRRIVAALETAHSRGIIHRDIKPANVLLDQTGVPFLADFGIAHTMGQTTTANIKGTFFYMAPEQWEGNEVGRYTDIYQLGVMLFEMLTNQRPFEAKTLASFVHLHLNAPIPSAHEVNPMLPPACDAVLAKAMAKKPEDRYDTPGELATALAQALATAPVKPGPSPDSLALVKGTKQNIGHYQLKSELGRGGMAAVFLTNDPRFGRDVALKVIRPELAQNETFRKRFKREAQTIAALEHSAIVPVYDFGEEEGYLYLAMRYMDGGTLADLIKQGPLPLAEVARILNRLCPALDEAHSRGIIHRDLKPANILLDKHHEPYLSDFGIAKLISEGETSITQAGGVVGSMAYMSPEQIERDGKLDGRSDIYALGIILFEMLTGQRPFSDNPIVSALRQHTQEKIPSVLEVNPDLPAACTSILEKALAKNPDDRFATAGELATAFAQLAGFHEIFPQPPFPEPAAPSHKHPFVYDEPVAPDKFVDRSALLLTLFNRSRNRESTAVWGAPQTGKSSLLLKLASEMTQSDSFRPVPSLLHFRGKNNEYLPVDFWEAALNPLHTLTNGSILEKRLQQAAKNGYDRTYLNRIFSHLAQKGIALILMIDDFDQLLHHRQFQDPSFYALLRSLATNTGGLSIIATSQLPVAEMSKSRRDLLERGSPFFNIMIEERMRPFAPTNVDELLDKAGKLLTSADKESVRQIAGNHPFLIQVTAATWIEMAPTSNRQLRTHPPFRQKTHPYFDIRWSLFTLEEKQLLLVLSLAKQHKVTLDLSDSEKASLVSPLLQSLIEDGHALPGANSEPVSGLRLSDKESGEIASLAQFWWLIDTLISDPSADLSYEVWFGRNEQDHWFNEEQWNSLINV